MRRDLVFTAHAGHATPATPITLAEAGLKERSDLQEWIREHPSVLGPGVRIVTYEFNKWVSTTGTPAGRLDLLGPDVLSQPRIVLVAGSFAESTTAAVVWLCEQGLDITLVRIGAYQCEHDLVVTVDQLWPLPSVDDFTVVPTTPSTKSGAKSSNKSTYTTAVASLAEKGAIVDGTELRLVPSGSTATAIEQWVAALPSRGLAIWRTGEKIRALEWPVDGQRYSASGLAERIISEASGAKASVNGAEWWALDDGTTLAELAGMSAGKKDWSRLHALLSELQPGEWTTYGELAHAVESHPIAVGQHLSRCSTCEHAWRVLGADGRPRPNFVWADPNETRSCREVLEDEGVEFGDSGSALTPSRVTAAELSARLG